MYFLSHFFIDRSRNEPHFAIGALIPDLVKGFTKVYNSKIRNNNFQLDEKETAIMEGIIRHFEVDKIFHTSTLFIAHCEMAKQELINSQLNREKFRLSVIAHLAVEILLDNWLMERFKLIESDYYELLAQVDTKTLNSFLSKILPELGKHSFLANFKRFKEIKLLYYFKNMEGVATGITKTYTMATGKEFNKSEEEKLVAALYNIKVTMRYSGNKLLNLNVSEK